MPKIVFSDFDGTLTLEGRELTRTFFDILEFVHTHNKELVIVSGRSISWGHFFLTHFPQLTAVIMEGGGVILERDKRGEIIEHVLVSENELRDLETATEELKRLFPACPLSADSFGRKTDRAIEFEWMADELIGEVLQFLKTNKVNYSKSNVHINYWCGEISKYKGVSAFLTRFRPDIKIEDSIFFGDAPNDQSMFELFPNSVGVSNIVRCLDRLVHKPRTILQGKENEGPSGVLNHLRSLTR